MPESEQVEMHCLNTSNSRENAFQSVGELSDESLIMSPIQIETTEISKQQNRNQLITYFKVFLLGVIFTTIVLFIFNFLLNYLQHPSIEKRNMDHSCRKRVIGYYNGWDNRTITEKQIEKLTHIIFEGVSITSNGSIEFENDEKKLLFLDMKKKANAMRSDVKIIFSTNNALNSKIISSVMADTKMRKIWISSITSFIVDHQTDGVELYWRWPNTKEDNENYIYFCRELRYNFGRTEKHIKRKIPYLISVLSPTHDLTTGNEIDLEELLQCADFLSIETDNFYGSWQQNNNLTGPLAPLYSTNGINEQNSIDWVLNFYTCKTMKPSRLNIILPFRGVYWNNVEDPFIAKNEMYRTVETTGGKANGSAIAWNLFEHRGWDLSIAAWHEETKTSYIWNSEERKFLAFDNERSLSEKVKYAIKKNIGGVSVWNLEYDDDANTLLNAVTSFYLCSGEKFEKDEIKYTCKDMEEEKQDFPLEQLARHGSCYNYFIYIFLLLCCIM